MPGVKKHRDGDYILEADLSKTQVKMVHKTADKMPKKDFMKRYGKDGDSVRYATATNMVKKKLGIGEEELEEAFTKKDFDKNEDENDHTLNAVMLAKEFGSSKEIKDMEDIDKRHRQRGHISEPDYSKRNAIIKKYYPRLK